jgi:positive regulator of sigma E activity
MDFRARFLARGPRGQSWLVILAIAFLAGSFWAVTTHDRKASDERYQQDKIDSDGEDAWLSSLTH